MSMPTYAEALAGIGAIEPTGTDLIIAITDGHGMHHHRVAELRDVEIDASSHVYLAGGAFEADMVSEFSGRKRENLRSVLWLQFDADLTDYSGMPVETLHHLPQSDIDRWIEAQRIDLEACAQEIGLPIHRLDYTGYGLCAYLYLEPTTEADVTMIRAAHKTLIKAINDRAGITLVDPQASDSGTRITRLPGSYNVKNPTMPRLVRTLTYRKDRRTTPDQLRFILKRAQQEVTTTQRPAATSLPEGMADEIIAAVRPHWTDGQKHAMALGLSGMLAKAGIPEAQTLSIIERLSDGDRKPIDRVRCVNDTYKRLASGTDVQGFMSLKAMMPETVLAYVAERLDRVKGATAPQGVFAFQTKPKEDKFISSLNVAPVPDICFNGWVGDYVSMMLPLSEAPESFHLASGLGLIGATAGRKVSARYTRRIYANHYFMLVGISGYSRKDTAIEFATEFPDHMDGRAFNSAPFQVLRDVGSSQGLLERMKDHPNIWLYITEYEQLAANAHRSSTSTIFSTLTQAWNTPPTIENVTKGSPIQANLPYLSIVAAVQPEILSQSMLPSDISSGFASRWLFVPGEGGEPIPYPPPINEAEAHAHYAKLLNIIEGYGGSDRPTRLELSPDAVERWTDWYMADRRHKPDSDDEASMRSRLSVHIQKIALTYAIGQGERQYIQLSQLDAAIAFVEWSWLHTREMLKDWGTSPINALEVRIEKVLRENGPLRKRDLQMKSKSRKWGATDFQKVIRAMVDNGTMVVDPEGYHALS
jgi:hypothetical protein